MASVEERVVEIVCENLGVNKESVTRALKGQGITPEENLDAGFHIKDTEGMNVQIVPA